MSAPTLTIIGPTSPTVSSPLCAAVRPRIGATDGTGNTRLGGGGGSLGGMIATMGSSTRPRLWAALASIAVAGIVGSTLLGVSAACGWITLDGPADRREIAIGILVLAIGGLASGALHQLLSRHEHGPEILLGQLVVLVAFAILGSLFDGRYERSAVAFGMIMIAGVITSLCQVGARLAWAIRERSTR